MPMDVKKVLQRFVFEFEFLFIYIRLLNIFRIWSDRMELEQLEHVISEIVSLHRSMKNLIEICFAISPLLLLSTHGWHRYSSRRIHPILVGMWKQKLRMTKAIQAIVRWKISQKSWQVPSMVSPICRDLGGHRSHRRC